MSEMVERVARGLWESEPVIFAWGPQERHRIPWDVAVERDLAGVGIFRQFARAAIKAMREPTEAMCDAGDEYNGNDRAVWQSMIDAALKD